MMGLDVVFRIVLFVKQRTAYEMRISDWSSDVCSSDLTDAEEGRAAVDRVIARLTGLGLLDDARYARERVRSLLARGNSAAMIRARLSAKAVPSGQIGRATCRERVCQYV